MKRLRGKNLIAADYDPVDGVLSVQFKSSGFYKYRGVPEEKWISLQRVPFPDRYFATAIKGKFPVEKGTVMEIFRKEDGLTFSGEGHRYELNGKPLVSLTQILSLSGLVDYSMVQPDVLAEKAKFGTKVHQYCEWLDTGELDLDDLKPYPAYYNRVLGWQQFCQDFQFTPDLNWCEVPAAVKVNGCTFGLTVDRFGVLGPVDGSQGVKPAIAVIELKTCAAAEPSHQIQTAGQVLLFKGDGSVPIKRFAVYLLDKPNGSGRCYRAVEHVDRMDEKILLCALTLTQFRINNGLLKEGKNGT